MCIINMKISQQNKKAFENTFLKKRYPEIEQRRKYADKRLSECKLKDPILIRFEPYPKTNLFPVFISLVVQKRTKIINLHNHFQEKILKREAKTALFFIIGTSLAPMGRTIQDIVTAEAIYEKILYIQYSDENPF